MLPGKEEKMAIYKDWMPGRRDEILALAGRFITQIGLHPAWGTPQSELGELTALRDAAQAALNTVESAAKTDGAVQTCRSAFAALKGKLRYVKRRWLIAPPLTPEDLAGLGLPQRAGGRSAPHTPVDQAGVEVVKWAPHSFGLRLYTQADMGGDKTAKYGVRVYYAPAEPGGAGAPTARRIAGDLFLLSAPPESPADLPNSFFTRKHHEDLVLPPEVSGKPCHFAARYENSKGSEGPWGSMVTAIIP